MGQTKSDTLGPKMKGDNAKYNENNNNNDNANTATSRLAAQNSRPITKL